MAYDTSDNQIREMAGVSSFLLIFMTNTPARINSLVSFVVLIDAALTKKYLNDSKGARFLRCREEINKAMDMIHEARALYANSETNWSLVERNLDQIYRTVYNIGLGEGLITIDVERAWGTVADEFNKLPVTPVKQG